MFKRWRELVPFIRLFRGHLKWMVLGTLSGLLAVASAVGLAGIIGLVYIRRRLCRSDSNNCTAV